MKKILLLHTAILTFFFFQQQISFAQNNLRAEYIKFDSLAGGNSKEVLSNFFNLALDKITGPDKEIKFTANLFALMLKKNADLNIDSNYKRMSWQRNTNLNFGLTLDSNKQFNGARLGFKYAIVNQRDVTSSTDFLKKLKQKNEIIHSLYDIVTEKIDLSILSKDQKKIINAEVQNYFLNKDGNALNYNNLSPELKTIIDEALNNRDFTELYVMIKNNPNLNIGNVLNGNYEQLFKDYQNKPIWTVGADFTSMTDSFKLSNVLLSTEYLKGISDPNKMSNFEISLKGSYQFLKDSTNQFNNLDRSQFNIEAGINWVLKGWNGDLKKSFIEMKATGAYSTIKTGLYKDEIAEFKTINGTIRFRLTENIWIPVEFKYDPEKNNVLGFISIKSNFNWMKLLKS